MRNTNRSDSHSLHVVGAAAALALAAALAPLGSAQAYTYKVLYTMCSQDGCADGSFPSGRLLMDSAGNLYGTTFGCDYHTQRNCTGDTSGSLFELVNNHGTYTEKVLYTFCKNGVSDGCYPIGGLILDRRGNLYGTTSYGGTYGGGTVFRLKARGTLQTLYDFCKHAGCPDGEGPDAPLTYMGKESGKVYDGESDLFGTTFTGGPVNTGCTYNGCGVAFIIPGKTSINRKPHAIYAFCSQSGCADGVEPRELIDDGNGNLYGAAGTFLPNYTGVAFELSPTGSANYNQTIVYDFCQQTNCSDGAHPAGALSLSGNTLVGLTLDGGLCGSGGVLYTLANNGTNWYESSGVDFCPSYGNRPRDKVLVSSSYFGVTELGGSYGHGTVWSQSGEIYQVLYNFCPEGGSCSSGKEPFYGVIADASGNLFGDTPGDVFSNGSTYGVVYELVNN